MAKYVCRVCGYLYDPVKGTETPDGPGAAFGIYPVIGVVPYAGLGQTGL